MKDVCTQGRAYNLVDMERTETRIDRALVEQARERARREDRGESDIIEDALRRYLAEEATFGEILDGVAACQREHGVEPLSDEEAMKLAVSEQPARRVSQRRCVRWLTPTCWSPRGSPRTVSLAVSWTLPTTSALRWSSPGSYSGSSPTYSRVRECGGMDRRILPRHMSGVPNVQGFGWRWTKSRSAWYQRIRRTIAWSRSRLLPTQTTSFRAILIWFRPRQGLHWTKERPTYSLPVNSANC